VFDLIAADAPARAFAFVEAIRERCGALKAHPQLGPARDELGAGVRILPMFRRVVVADPISENHVEILRIFYGGRDHAALMREGPA
jgi:toxin ParE1/3/4